MGIAPCQRCHPHESVPEINHKQVQPHRCLHVAQALVAQLHSLPAETLRLQLTAKKLISTGNKSILAQRLYNALRCTETLPSATSTVPTTSADTQQSTTFVTTSNPPGDQQTRTTQSAVSINTDQDSSLHPQHLANLLLLTASQLSTTPIQ